MKRRAEEYHSTALKIAFLSASAGRGADAEKAGRTDGVAEMLMFCEFASSQRRICCHTVI